MRDERVAVLYGGAYNNLGSSNDILAIKQQNMLNSFINDKHFVGTPVEQQQAGENIKHCR